MKAAALMLGALGLLGAAPAHADVTIPTAGVVPLTAATGTGLVANYYKTGVTFSSGSGALIYATGHAPTATFTSTSASYINPAATSGSNINSYTDSSTTLQTFLGSDYNAGNPGLFAARNNTLSNQLFTFTGYLKIAAPENVTFDLGSDDGSTLTINGTTVIDNGTAHPYATLANTADFSQAGFYAVNIVYYENSGYTGVLLTSNLNGSGTLNGTTQSVISSALFYPTSSVVPEPASYVSFFLGGLGLLALSLKARKRGVTA